MDILTTVIAIIAIFAMLIQRVHYKHKVAEMEAYFIEEFGRIDEHLEKLKSENKRLQADYQRLCIKERRRAI